MRSSIAALVFSGFVFSGMATPAAAQELFTLDFDNDGVSEVGGSDDRPVSFTGTVAAVNGGAVDAVIRAVDLSQLDAQAVQAFSGVELDLDAQDVFVFDVTVNSPSAPIDQVIVGIGTDVIDPIAVGYFGDGLAAPSAIAIQSGFGWFAGAARFDFDFGNLGMGNLEAGETSVRLFVAYPGNQEPDKPLGPDQVANFTISSGLNEDFQSDIGFADAPLAMLGLGLLGIALARRGRDRRGLRSMPCWLVAALGLSLAPVAHAAPDLSLVSIVHEDDGLSGVCDAPCFSLEKRADVFLDGNPTAPGVCPAGSNTYVYTLTHLGGSGTRNGGQPGGLIAPLTQFEIEADFLVVTSAGFIPGPGVAPSSTIASPLDVVTWDFPTNPVFLGQSTNELFLCSPASPTSASGTRVSANGVFLAAPGSCIGPERPPRILLSPERSLNEPGQDHTVTAEVSLAGAPLIGEEVSFDVLSGPNAASGGDCTFNADCTTDDDGRVFFTYTGDGGPGVDEIIASFVDVGSGDTVESTSVLKFWDVDCNQNEIPDTCDVDCGGFGDACLEFAACGALPDDDGDGVPDDCNTAPDCAGAGAEPDEIWPPNGGFRDIAIAGVTDEDGDAIAVTITAIFQDEPVQGAGDGTSSPDASGVGTGAAQVRAERSGTPQEPGDGRVYHIDFEADDGLGGTCAGEVMVCVPHDPRPGHACVDQGALFDSTDAAGGPHSRGPRCGLGFELCLVVPALAGLRRRKLRRPTEDDQASGVERQLAVPAAWRDAQRDEVTLPATLIASRAPATRFVTEFQDPDGPSIAERRGS